MAERPLELGDFLGVGHIEAKFQVESYISRRYLQTVRYGNGYTTTLPLEVFTQRNCVAHALHSPEVGV